MSLVKKRSYGTKVGPKANMTSVFIGRGRRDIGETDRERKAT